MMSEEESEKRPEDARGRMFGRVLCNRRVTWCVPGRTSWGGVGERNQNIKLISQCICFKFGHSIPLYFPFHNIEQNKTSFFQSLLLLTEKSKISEACIYFDWSICLKQDFSRKKSVLNNVY